MTGSIAVVGSVNLDQTVRLARAVKPGETVLATGYSEAVGGKGFNQAVGAARLVPTALVAAVGDDERGAHALTAATRRSVDTGAVLRSASPTGLALINVTDDGENSIAVVPLANLDLIAEHVVTALDRLRPDLVLVQLEIRLETVVAAARWAQAHGARFVMNASPVQPIPAELLASVDPLIVNAAEAAELAAVMHLDSDGSVDALAASTRSMVVTRGASGADLHRHGAAVHVPAPSVRAVDTTGAGDEFAGALCAALAQGHDLLQAVADASTAAARLVQRPRSER